jgi:hypothetical protein
MNRIDLAGLIGAGIGFAAGALMIATLTGFMC